MIIRTFKRVIKTGIRSAGARGLCVLFRILQPMSPKCFRSDLRPLDGPRAG
ncbi:MAG: hypothetical protein KJZ65_03115 [Phycisphaerales bacterium]|nr:hypothetical protein [Phycisphaerales bacterium]